jgi:hypothetical protein
LNLYLLAVEHLENSPYFCAQAHRKIGEIYESLNEIGNAVEHYELALKFNSKVGVKIRLQSLKEKMGK